MSEVEVVCVGVLTIDSIALVENYPDEDERVLAKEITRAGGGPAAVAAVALSRLGVKTAIVGTIGDDSEGAQILAIFEREGVEASGISIGNLSTSSSVIVVSGVRNTRAISTRQPIVQSPLNSQAQDLMREAAWVHVDHVGINQLTSAGIKRGSGVKISFDAGYGAQGFDASQVDLFVPTDRQMAMRHPQLRVEVAVEVDSKESGNIVVATAGAKGSYGYSAISGLVRAEAFSLDIKSTLGAGDVFHGALVAQIIQGHSLKEALRRANAVAALSCRGLDAQSMIPTTQQLNAFLEE